VGLSEFEQIGLVHLGFIDSIIRQEIKNYSSLQENEQPTIEPKGEFLLVLDVDKTLTHFIHDRICQFGSSLS
jgi:hypothetical protein